MPRVHHSQRNKEGTPEDFPLPLKTAERSVAVHPSFVHYLESLHPLFERLIDMQPVTIATLPKDAPHQCIYLFSEAGRHLYVGRTHRQSLRKRLRQHSTESAQHNQAVFAFKLAREMTKYCSIPAFWTARKAVAPQQEKY